MRNSLIILLFFAAGVAAGLFDVPYTDIIGGDGTRWVLYLLMLLVGVTIGSDRATLAQLKGLNLKILLVPAATIIGTLGRAALVSLFMEERTLAQCLMVGSGFGYYSLSSVLITESHGAALGTVALLSNVLREITTLVLAPLMVRWCGPLAPITCGGATTIDTTLPVIVRYSGKDFIFVAVVNGIVVDFSVPLLVTFFAMF